MNALTNKIIFNLKYYGFWVSYFVVARFLFLTYQNQLTYILLLKNFILCLLFVFVFSPTKAQNSIRGKITDNLNSPLSFANIILLQKGNETFIKGVVSDDKGNYLFEDIENGTYQLEVSVLGFETKKTEE